MHALTLRVIQQFVQEISQKKAKQVSKCDAQHAAFDVFFASCFALSFLSNLVATGAICNIFFGSKN